MFDPTVFDNLKVVLEGAIYDYDLNGHIEVIDRKDLVDLATLKREYNISIKTISERNTPYCKMTLTMDLENISSELLKRENAQPGCAVFIEFTTEVNDYVTECEKILQILTRIWGTNRLITQHISFIYNQEKIKFLHNTSKIQFNHLIGEEHVEDLVEMVDYIINTLDDLNSF
ncbi:hypothetical protein [Litchfieldia alkalitelluris]|uniref:hypothetical protein n=1 Tax=Litchfieldia alkalitelluris TaxID=304268 RepID=UPI00195E5E75|nr:hypothetical protein [Litchfieldia alkalitelluris]